VTPARRLPDPLLLVLAGVAVGIGVVALRHAQDGLYVVAASLGAGAVLRLVLRPRDAGSLVVRSRRLDVFVLAGLAIALAVIAAVTPFPSGRA
jgi:hypothetical protein